MERVADLSLEELAVPPAGALLKIGELPPAPRDLLLPAVDLADWRGRAVAPPKPVAAAPSHGLLAVNQTHLPRYLLLEGVPVAWIAPGGKAEIVGPKSGRYSVAWRDTFGIEPMVQSSVHLPARVVLGEPARPGAAAP
jgi:hypothetical protein